MASAAMVGNLIDLLGPEVHVLLHHDWHQQPGFDLKRPNVAYVADPVRTGWANWGMTQAIFKLLEAALAGPPFDYFQLMTPSCLPIKPVAALADHVGRSAADFHVDIAPIDSEPTFLMSHGYRAFAPVGTLRYRALWRASRWYFDPAGGTRNRLNLSFPLADRRAAGGLAGARASLALAATRLAGAPGRPWHPYDAGLRCHVGCTWFGASPAGAAHLLERSREQRLSDWFARVGMSGEIMLPTLIGSSGLRIAPSNYLLSEYDGARPRDFGIEDLPQLRASDRFLARKFPPDAHAPIRRAVAALVRPGVSPP